MTASCPIDRNLIQQAIEVATDRRGDTPRDEQKLALIEALLCEALSQDHGAWRWRVPNQSNGPNSRINQPRSKPKDTKQADNHTQHKQEKKS
jgi:hypothetical protein